MEYGLAIIIVLACVIPFFIGAGFGLNALLQHCSSDSGCHNDEMCLNNKCVYACKDKSCPTGAICRAKHHTFSCECSDHHGVSPDDTMSICKKLCYDDSACALSESCQLGLCMDACHGYACDGNKMALAYKHKCTCECSPGFRLGFNETCRRIPKCSNDYDCHYSEKCIRKKCVGVCRNKVCPPNEMCLAYNHTSVCYDFSANNEVYRKSGYSLAKNSKSEPEWSVVSPLSREILSNILAFSTSGETKNRISMTLNRSPDVFNLKNISDWTFNEVNRLIKNFHKIGPDVNKIYLKANTNSDIRSAANKFGIQVNEDLETTSVTLRLRQVMKFMIDPGQLETDCVVNDNKAQTMELIGEFSTGVLIETDFEFVVIPYKKSVKKLSGISLVFLYNKKPCERINSTISEKLSALLPNVFFSDTNVKKKMGIVVSNSMNARTTVNFGETLLRYSLNIVTPSFTVDNGTPVDYQSNKYEILQSINLKMRRAKPRACIKPDPIGMRDVRFLNATDYAMFIVSNKYAYFYAVYA